MRRAALALLFLITGCAQTGGPPGGPIDDIPPTVVGTLPSADSTGVFAPHPLSIEFSEKMDKRAVERSLRIFPRPGWIRTDWSETTLLVETDLSTGAVPDDGKPVTVTVSGRVEDRRGNRIAEPFLFSYTAADELPPGTISGIVEGIQKSRGAPAVTVRAIDAVSSTVLTESEAADLGGFTLPHLPAGGESRLVAVAFQDEDEDGEIDYEYEFYGFSDTITLALE